MPKTENVQKDALIPIVEEGANKTMSVEQLTDYIAPEHNMVGKFADDSTPDDWYWHPNGTKLAIPVDPATGEFSYYFDGKITAQKPFAPDYEINQGMPLVKIERLDKIPQIVGNAYHHFFQALFRSKTCPVIDCSEFEYLNYFAVNNSEISYFPRVQFINTEHIRAFEMLFNLNANHKLIAVMGLDLSNCRKFMSYPLGKNNSAPYIQLLNLGKAQTIENDGVIDCRASSWGDDSKATGARKSLVDSLLTNSFDRASAGYVTATILLMPAQYDRLTAEERTAIENKGYNIEVQN